MPKRPLGLAVNSALIDRLNERTRRDGRRQISLVEQALAEFLHIPLADRSLPQQPVELCPHCQQGIITDRGRCLECRWHRDPRRSMKPPRARAYNPPPPPPKPEAP